MSLNDSIIPFDLNTTTSPETNSPTTNSPETNLEEFSTDYKFTPNFDSGTPHYYELLLSYLNHTKFYFKDLVSNNYINQEIQGKLEEINGLISRLSGELEEWAG